MNTFASCLVLVAYVGSSWAIGPSCDCGLYSPNKHYVDRLPLVWYTKCAPDDTSCTCQQRSDACIEACHEDATFHRPQSTEVRWRDTACSREDRLIEGRGETMVAGSSLSFVDDCNNSPVQYKTLSGNQLCCRLTYSRYISTSCYSGA